MAAIVDQASKNNLKVLNRLPIKAETLALLNNQKKQSNGLWPKEQQAINYINAVFRDIKAAPADQRREKINAAKHQFSTMVDANLATVAAPDSASTALGLSAQSVQNRKAAARAANTRLENALKQLN